MRGSPAEEALRCACIDIGTNTTRLLVAEWRHGVLVDVCQRRAYTRAGAGFDATGALTDGKRAELVAAVGDQAGDAREAGARAIRAVGTAALRRAVNADVLAADVRASCGLELEVLSEADEARLTFAGAVGSLPASTPGMVAVVDVGGGSCEIVVGSPDRAIRWWASVPTGSSDLAAAHLHSDPPSPAEIRRAGSAAREALGGLTPPVAGLALAVGGSAASLRRLVGPLLDRPALDRALRVLAGAPAQAVAEDFGLDPVRVRLLPAGLVLLGEAAVLLGRPLRIGAGGLREGVLLEVARAA